MTSQLIPVFNGTISNETALLVNARDLHSFLDVGKRFASWIVERIAEYGLVENQDFMIISQVREKIGRGRPAKDYHLTLDTAKELAMVERNEKGRQIRRYFIECEKKLRSMQPAQQFTDEEIILLCYMQVQMENAQDGGSRSDGRGRRCADSQTGTGASRDESPAKGDRPLPGPEISF